jgi:hypothetical protein
VPLVFSFVLSLDPKFMCLVFFVGVAYAVDFGQVLPIFISVTGPHRCSSFSCSSPGPHFRVALFLVRLAERWLGSTSSCMAGCVAQSLEPRPGFRFPAPRAGLILTPVILPSESKVVSLSCFLTRSIGISRCFECVYMALVVFLSAPSEPIFAAAYVIFCLPQFFWLLFSPRWFSTMESSCIGSR